MTISPWRLNAAIALVASILTATTASAAYSLFMGGPWSTRTWIIVILIALTALPIIALLQGIFALLHYRLFYIDSPVPKTPSHGVVLVPEEQNNSTSNSCRCCAPPQRQQDTTPSDSSDPIRVLVIGDSLAIGVGQSRSCCPVLPETIAKSLCRYFGGRRPVFWSCHGEPGASAGWIVRELEKRLPHQELATSKSIMLQRAFSTAGTVITNTDDSCSETTSTTSSVSSDDADDEEDSGNESDCCHQKMAFDMPCNNRNADDHHDMKDEKFWKQRLSEHSCCLESNPLDGYYDVVVVMTGSNDLKSAIFPFLLTGDDVEFRKQARERGGSYMRELCRVLQVIQPRLRKQNSGATNTGDDLASASPSPRLPLVVLPGMPAEALPIFRPYPLHWAAVPFVDCMDRQKQKLADSRSGQVLFVPPPTLKEICQFESRCDRVLPEVDEFVKLRDVTSSECEKIRDTMDSYYHSAAVNRCEVPSDKQPLSQRSGQPGTKIFSLDRIHPNDDGYDFWGRFIADAIVREWEIRK